jgi:hypothetical protein
MRQTLSMAVFILFLTACNLQVKDSADKSNGPSYTVPDDAAITKAVHDAYSCICFKNSNPAYDSIKNYFIPEAQLINFRTDRAEVTTLPQFVDLYRQFLQTNKVTLFYEEEIAGRNEQFGNIAHRISSYKTFVNQMDSAFERGVNSFQLIKTPNGWKVSSIIWDVEKPQLPIPAYYLKQDSSQRN